MDLEMSLDEYAAGGGFYCDELTKLAAFALDALAEHAAIDGMATFGTPGEVSLGEACDLAAGMAWQWCGSGLANGDQPWAGAFRRIPRDALALTGDPAERASWAESARRALAAAPDSGNTEVAQALCAFLARKGSGPLDAVEPAKHLAFALNRLVASDPAIREHMGSLCVLVAIRALLFTTAQAARDAFGPLKTSRFGFGTKQTPQRERYQAFVTLCARECDAADIALALGMSRRQVSALCS
ncbi:MAG: hypothetical protein E7A62_09100 [Actinomycetaceae bacterium]|nr:hypothetical protein [Actinomycetaceae bacterium]MDU0971127.1 hypothetical protein [Actinomycetaceae bacterium]